MTTFAAELATILNTTEANVWKRANGLRILPACNRCGGTGQYSFNGTHSTCYGCNGARSRMPTAGEQLDVLEDAQAAMVDGRNATYMQYLAATATAKRAAQTLMNAWKACEFSKHYRWQMAAEYVRTGNEEFRSDRDIADINKKACDAYTRVYDASNKLNSKSETYQADVIALAAMVETELAVVATAKAELEEYLK